VFVLSPAISAALLPHSQMINPRLIHPSINQSINRVATVLSDIKSRTFQGFPITFTTFVPNLFRCSFQHMTQLLWHQVSKLYCCSQYCAWFTGDCTIFHTICITDHFGIQALSRTSYAKFQNFQASNQFPCAFPGLEKLKRFFKKFQGLSKNSDHPESITCYHYPVISPVTTQTINQSTDSWPEFKPPL